ncbi:MAG: DUF4417 domain-containing protein [Lentisphaeria bacterium]|nr:DUF4417 domain-containing protein [Lentisphaeria bacterium]
MSDYFGQHREADWKLWNLPQYLSIPAWDIGAWGIPFAKKCDHVPRRLMPFNYAIGKNADPSCGVHFFINDYQFERVWRTPEKYIEILSRFDCVIAPDFSVYNDMPTCMQLWQHFKSRMFAYMCYQAGLNVIPNLIFSDTRTFSKRNGFVFDGIESDGTVCLSTSGCRRNPEYRKGIIEGVKVFLDVCEPKTIIVYGDAPDIDFGSIEIVEFKPFGFGKQFISERKQKECKK